MDNLQRYPRCVIIFHMCTFTFAPEETTSLVVRNSCKLKLELDTETVQPERLNLQEVLIRRGGWAWGAQKELSPTIVEADWRDLFLQKCIWLENKKFSKTLVRVLVT